MRGAGYWRTVDHLKIALDYDGTYTRDPGLWSAFISAATRLGHDVICVTMRTPGEEIQMPCPVIYTSREAKAHFMDARSEKVDVWIDDAPQWLYRNG